MKNVVSEISRHREIFKALELQDIIGTNEESKLMDRNSLFNDSILQNFKGDDISTMEFGPR